MIWGVLLESALRHRGSAHASPRPMRALVIDAAAGLVLAGVALWVAGDPDGRSWAILAWLGAAVVFTRVQRRRGEATSGK